MGGPRGRYSGGPLFSQLRRDLDELFQELVTATEGPAQAPTWHPRMDVLELPGALLVLVEVPGVTAAEIAVEIIGERLRIQGRRRLSFPEQGERRFHGLERREGTFLRQVEVAGPVNFAEARACLARGVLTIELPRLQDRRQRRRSIAIVELEEVP